MSRLPLSRGHAAQFTPRTRGHPAYHEHSEDDKEKPASSHHQATMEQGQTPPFERRRLPASTPQLPALLALPRGSLAPLDSISWRVRDQPRRDVGHV